MRYAENLAGFVFVRVICKLFTDRDARCKNTLFRHSLDGHLVHEIVVRDEIPVEIGLGENGMRV